MSEWQEFGVLLAIHRHAHSIKREMPPVDAPAARDGVFMRLNQRSVTAEFARTVAA